MIKPRPSRRTPPGRKQPRSKLSKATPTNKAPLPTDVNLLTRAEMTSLMAQEKKRLGLDPEKLVFVGIHNLAQYWWCAEYAVLKSRENELEFFNAYLYDRIAYSHEAGLINRLPPSTKDWLSIGDLSGDQVEVILANRAKRMPSQGRRGHIGFIQVGGQRYLNPSLPEGDRRMFHQEAIATGVKVGDLQDAPLMAGHLMEDAYAEQYPRLRWNWSWKRLVVVGVPDGITEKFVYEFKSTRSIHRRGYVEPVARAQADLYGHFWKRGRKRVQIVGREDGETLTIDEPVDEARAIDTLTKFEEVDSGKPAIRPAAWKCNRCEFRDRCPVFKGSMPA